jgi:hypothetical protein
VSNDDLRVRAGEIITALAGLPALAKVGDGKA